MFALALLAQNSCRQHNDASKLRSENHAKTSHEGQIVFEQPMQGLQLSSQVTNFHLLGLVVPMALRPLLLVKI